jgi:hypothetical protein
MTSNLILPRVRVSWAGINLSSYDGSGDFPKYTPAVYDVDVQLQSQTQAPTASMKWDPTGPGFALYESFISNEEYMKSRIFIDFFYAGGKRIRFAFLIGYEPKAKESMEKATLQNAYGSDQTYAASVANLAQQNGNTAFANNIGGPNIVIFSPYSWKPEKNIILNGATDIPPDTDPKPDQRYGYIVGPAIIDSLVRETEWKPPQQTNQNTPSTQTKARDPETGRFVKQTPETSPQIAVSETKKETSSPVGTANARANPGVKNLDNPDGPTKQNALEDERTATMSFQTLMCPVLVGIKPYDVVYLPSLTGKYIEDWIVESVGYDQNNGNVSVSVQATREYGLGTPMDKKNAEVFEAFAKTKGLIGEGASLKNWEQYAWSLSPGAPSATPT